MQRFSTTSLNNFFLENEELKNKLESKLLQIEKNLNEKINYEMPSFCAGLSGISLFYAYLYKFTGDKIHFQKMNSLINKIVDALEQVEIDVDYSHGITGVAWCIQHLINENLIDKDYEESLTDFDTLIFDTTKNDILSKRYDYFVGILGKGNYFLERYKSDRTVGVYIISIVTELLTLKEENFNTIFWQDYYGYKRTNSYDELITLGLAHGISSIIVFLSRVEAEKMLTFSLIETIDKLSNFVLSSLVLEKKPNYFPYHLKNGVPESEHQSRMAWCHGDPGIIVALLIGSKVTLNDEIFQFALKHGVTLLKRTHLSDNGILDACICHGSAGLAQIFSRIYDYTGENDFLKFSCIVSQHC
ncbi:MAG: lanthionine synthetase LanC family protein [Flavobacterium sp.]|nr:lanthionine synthetase LanC family protein [Flavobacterium sp.]